MSDVYQELTACRICPHNCGIDRNRASGFCNAPAEIKVNLASLHHGEEPVLSGTQGSGTIFFSHCNLRCVFCQNHNISALGWGEVKTDKEVLAMMLDLQEQGAHNINLVTPAHYSVQLADILQQAKMKGLEIPVVWNTNAYEKMETLKRLEGLVDVYLPDLKYADGKNSARYSGVKDYPEIARAAIREMLRQVGQLRCDEEGIAQRGLIIRLLVLPDRIAGTADSLHWIADNLGNETFISLMAQYYPTWQADKYPEINRGITQAEYDEVTETLAKLDFYNGFVQELSCSSEWTPDFVKEKNK